MPLDTPVTIPFTDPMVATEEFAELHTPPEAVFDRVVVAPAQV